MSEQNKNDLSGMKNELNKKQAFIDIDTKPAQPKLIESYADVPEPAFDQKAVLDEAFAERKTLRETKAAARPQPASARRDLNTALPKLPRRKPAKQPRRVRTVRFTDVRLCSGELSSDALRRIAREFGALLLFCAVVAAVFWLKGFVLDLMTNDDYSALARSTTYSDPVTTGGVKWTDSALPDGLAAAQAVCTKLDAPITDDAVLNKRPDALLYPAVVSAGMETTLTSDRVQLKTNMSNLDLLLQIYMSLDSGKPVIVLHSDKESSALRYGIVTYMDAENDTITVQISDGSTQILTFEQFIAATRFENTEKLPFQIRAGLAFGSWSRNTAIFVE